jgi:hypothetical protein
MVEGVIEILRANPDEILDRREARRDARRGHPRVLIEKKADDRILVQRLQCDVLFGPELRHDEGRAADVFNRSQRLHHLLVLSCVD